MEWYEAEVRSLEQALRSDPPPADVIAFYGSSSIRLWTTLTDDFPDLPVVNLGFGGSTLAACVYFFERLVLPCNPRAIVFYAGDNDLGDGQTAEQVQESFQNLRAKVRTYFGAIRFAFISVKPSVSRIYIREQIERTNRLIRAELAQWPTASYIDIYHAMLDMHGQPRRELFAEDGLHLSSAGYRLWAQMLNAEKRKFA